MKYGYFFLVLAAASLSSSCGIEIVDTGYRGVKTRFGKVVGEPLDEGLYFYNPLTSKIVELEVRMLRFDSKTETYTRDVQQANITYTINIALDKNHVTQVYSEFGPRWLDRVVPQVIEGSLKGIVGRWDAVDLISNRQKATLETEATIREALKDKFIEVKRFELTNITFQKAFEEAVERKVIAIQRAVEAENKTKQIEEEAKQQIISAKAEAESMRIRAQALSQNKGLVEYEAVQKWDGKLPGYMMGNSVPFVNLK